MLPLFLLFKTRLRLLNSMARNACYGTCPIYKITIRADGAVAYEGIKFVKTEGRLELNLERAKGCEITPYLSRRFPALHGEPVRNPYIGGTWS